MALGHSKVALLTNHSILVACEVVCEVFFFFFLQGQQNNEATLQKYKRPAAVEQEIIPFRASFIFYLK